MAKLTRKDVINRVEAGDSLEQEDLSGLDLSRANLTTTNLIGADFSDAALGGVIGANFSGALAVSSEYLKD
mgnify:CR=1 FL=1